MLSLDQCREVLGPDSQLSEEELERLRDQLYALADITISMFLERRERDRAVLGNKPLTRRKVKPVRFGIMGRGDRKWTERLSIAADTGTTEFQHSVVVAWSTAGAEVWA